MEAGLSGRDEWVVDARAVEIAALRAAVTAFASRHGAADDIVHAVALAVTEAATNAVLHAYVGAEPGPICVSAEAGAGELRICVMDRGRGMQPRIDSPGMGAGLPTIGQVTTSMDVRRRDDGPGTEVRMTFAAPGVRGPRRFERGHREVQLLRRAAKLLHGEWPGTGLRDLAALLAGELADAVVIDIAGEAGSFERVASRVKAESEHLVPEPGGMPADPAPGWWLSTPIRSGGNVLGLLGLGGGRDRLPPDSETRLLVAQIADQTADALAASRLIEHAARTSRRLDRILGVLAEAVTVNDPEGRVVYANDAAVRLLGAESRDEVLAAQPGELAARFHITREDGSGVSPADLPGARVLGGEAVPSLLTRSVHIASGRARWLLTKSTLLDGEERLAVNVIEDVTEAKEAELRWRFLSRAGAILASSLDYERTLEQVAWLAVPDLADWCAVDIFDDGELRRLAVAHVDADKLAVGRELHERYPPDLDAEEGAGSVLRTGEPWVVSDLSDDFLVSVARDERHLQLLRSIGLRSAIIAPLTVGDRVTGMISFVTAESRRTFSADDVEFFGDLASRAAVAVENARLYTRLSGSGRR